MGNRGIEPRTSTLSPLRSPAKLVALQQKCDENRRGEEVKSMSKGVGRHRQPVLVTVPNIGIEPISLLCKSSANATQLIGQILLQRAWTDLNRRSLEQITPPRGIEPLFQDRQSWIFPLDHSGLILNSYLIQNI